MPGLTGHLPIRFADSGADFPKIRKLFQESLRTPSIVIAGSTGNLSVMPDTFTVIAGLTGNLSSCPT